MRHLIPDTRAAAAGHRPGGGVIVVVLALLTSLMFLGIIFYEFSSQEKNAAEAGSRSRERDDQVDLPYTPVADEALEQILIGASIDAPLSSQWTGDSILADTIGRPNTDGSLIDTAPHSGRGVAVWVSPAADDTDGDGVVDANTGSEIFFDYDGDGAPDWDGTDFVLNLSPAANLGFPDGAFDTGWGGSELIFANYLETDQGYTYPDFNSPWLAFDGYLTDAGGNPVHIIKPSFFFPEYFPDYRTGTFFGLTSNINTVRQILHPHQFHVAHPVDDDGDGVPDVDIDGDGVRDTSTFRFLTVPTPAQSGDTSRILPPFPFEVDADGDGVFGEMGVWTNSDSYDLPVDADGDGTRDSVRIDIGHGIIDLPGGRQVVPLVAYKVIELDGLFDLNSHGNPAVPIAASNASGLTDPFGTFHSAPLFLHYSGWGYSPSEINPLVGLLGDPSTITDPDEWQRATLPHQGMYALAGNTGMTFNRLQMANTEMAMLRYGRFEFYMDSTGALALVSSDPTDHHVGLWGANGAESGLLYSFLGGGGQAPSAGVLGEDDDGDDNEPSNPAPVVSPSAPPYTLFGADAYGDGGRPLSANGVNRPTAIPPVVHPLNMTGLGNDVQADLTPAPVNAGAVPLLAGTGVGTEPMVWKQYDLGSFPQTQDSSTTSDPIVLPVHGVRPYYDALGIGSGTLQPTAVYDGLFNEPDEIILEPSLMNGYDAPFGFEELAGLHWSENDWDRYGHTSRLRQLMPFNFDWATTPVPASYIRGQYSVSNVDRLEFGHHMFGMDSDGDGVGDRDWEFNDDEDVNDDGIGDPSEDLDGDGVVLGDSRRFPPRFGTAGSSRHEQTPPIISSTDPFRPEIRRLLTIVRYSQTPGRPYFPQHRLNINRILADDQANSGPAAFDSYGNPQYRHLVPHPAEGNGAGQIAPGSEVPDMIHDNGVTVPAALQWSNISGDAEVQEWWARYDRQRLARDIYVLLYTLGGPDSMGGSPFNPTTTPYATGLDANGNGIDDMVEAMAQFAVNFVDQLDRDGVITKFEYDPDLSNGWEVGWNPGDPPPAVAFGVEHQQLVFSEVMYIQNAVETSDNATTLHNDENDTHRWLHVELRNAGPFPVDLKEETWRLARFPTGADPSTIAPDASVDFGNAANYRTVDAGQNILISMHDGTVTNANSEIICSDFYADYTGGAELESVLPDSGTTIVDNAQDPPPTTDIDLCDELRATPAGHDLYYTNVQPMAPGGATLVAPVSGGGPINETFDLVLMRGRKTATGGIANVEWIEVDRFRIESTDAEFGASFDPAGDSQAENDTALTALNSRERRQPFDERIQNNPGLTPPLALRHSMVTGANKHAANDYWLDPANVLTTALYPNFTCWQPHFDRDYASVMELLSLPLFGADDVVSQLYTIAATPNAPVLDYDYTAGLRFMNPDGSDANAGSAMTDPAWVNRWYRLLEFLEVRERTHDSLAERLQYLRRTYGRMNLNGIRHAHVLAGLVDDSYHLDVAAADPTQDLLDGGRDWFDELLLSRDGLDHITSLPLPGLPQARPFRNLSHINPNDPDQSEQDTILRSTGSAPSDPMNALDYFGLFEARSMGDIPFNGGTDEVDYHTRNRLLGKIHNLTTNRSHLFACWISVEFFEAHQIPVDMDGDGDADTDADGVPEGYATQVGGLAGDLPMRRMFCVIDRSRLEEAYDPTTGRFDFRQFIVYKRWID